jgi:hypothetical protein
MELSDSDADSEKTLKLNGKQQLVCNYNKFTELERNATLRPFVEVFAGSCHLSHAFNDAGHPNYSFDVKIDETHNMITEKGLDLVRQKIHDLAAAGGKLPYIHFAPPCSTYSQARYPKIRSTSNPQGLPAKQLTQHDRNILRHANKITANTFKLMTELTQQGFPVSIEQPASSMTLRLKSFKGWAAQSGASPVLVDYCRQFGMPYRKRTVLWTSPAGLLAGLERRCPGLSDEHRHECSLSGWDMNENRRLSTSLGCSAYPELLCQEWVREFNTFKF